MSQQEFIDRYPHIAFNDDPRKRNKDHYLFLLDTASISPAGYDPKVIRLYKGVITWNPKVFSQLSSWGANVFKIGEYPRFEDYGTIEEYPELAQKEGVAVVQHKVRHDMSTKQSEVFMDITGFPHYAYGTGDFGGRHHKGELRTKADKINALSRHKFVVCFENVYHPLWSHNYLSENIFDCFRAKTIPIYVGAYNIDELIPPNFFINYNDFRNADELSEYLLSFEDDVYSEIVEKSYHWAIANQWNPTRLIAAFNKL